MNTCFLTSHIGGEYKDLQETACKPQIHLEYGK